jgi:hypothetical protein
MTIEARIYVETPNGPKRAFLPFSGMQAIASQLPAEFGNGRTYALAMQILTMFFGLPWMETYVMANTPSSSFLRSRLAETDLHSIRVIHLAEMIFNLQKVAGLDEVLVKIRTGDVESGFAELEAAKLLYKYGIAFRFVETQGVRRKDYDLEFFHHNGMLVCADTKCKLETTDLTSNTIKNALNGARDQLPNDKPGYVFVKVPQDWLASSGFFEEFDALSKAFFRGTGRVVGIQCFASLVRIEQGIIHDNVQGREFRNEKHRFDPSLDWRLLTRYSEWLPEPLSWIKLTSNFPFVPSQAYNIKVNYES